jgi:Tol biopolymer transport system component
MSVNKSKNSPVPVSRLDVTVAIVAVLLVSATIGLSYFSSPERAGSMVAFLYPAYGGLQNVWMAPVNNPQDAIQVTNAKAGIYDFNVSPDGHYIAYAERSEDTNLNDIYLLNMQSRQVQQLTNCSAEGADCRTPVFRPGGGLIAYERMTAPDKNVGYGAIRIWLLDLSKQPYTTRPLSDDSQFIGHSPQWSDDGNTIAFFSADITNPGIMVYSFVTDEGEKSLKFVPSNNGVVGTLSPSGRKMVFPDVTQSAQGIVTQLKITDLDKLEFLPLTDSSEPVEDNGAAWNPDGKHLAIERRYSDDRYTKGFQIYLFDPDTGQLDPLSVDARYSHGYMEWNSTGDKLVFQRFALDVGNARPEIWVRDMTTGELVQISDNAFLPRFVLP